MKDPRETQEMDPATMTADEIEDFERQVERGDIVVMEGGCDCEDYPCCGH